MDNELQEWSNLWQSEKENEMIKMIHIGEKLSKMRRKQVMQLITVWATGLVLVFYPMHYFQESGFKIENIIFASFLIPYGIGYAIWYTHKLLRVEKALSQNPDEHVSELQNRLEQAVKINNAWWSLWAASIFSVGFTAWLMTRYFEVYSQRPLISFAIIGSIASILIGCYVYQRYAIGKSERELAQFHELVGEL
jgi:DMSO reductase anchor subunit